MEDAPGIRTPVGRIRPTWRTLAWVTFAVSGLICLLAAGIWVCTTRPDINILYLLCPAGLFLIFAFLFAKNDKFIPALALRKPSFRISLSIAGVLLCLLGIGELVVMSLMCAWDPGRPINLARLILAVVMWGGGIPTLVYFTWIWIGLGLGKARSIERVKKFFDLE